MTTIFQMINKEKKSPCSWVYTANAQCNSCGTFPTLWMLTSDTLLQQHQLMIWNGSTFYTVPQTKINNSDDLWDNILEETLQLTVVIWNLPKCYIAGLVSLTEYDTHKWMGHWEKRQIQRTSHTEVEQHIICSPQIVWNYHLFPVLLVIIRFFESWYEWQQRNFDTVVTFLQEVQQLSLTIFYLWSIVLALLGLKPGSIQRHCLLYLLHPHFYHKNLVPYYCASSFIYNMNRLCIHVLLVGATTLHQTTVCTEHSHKSSLQQANDIVSMYRKKQ